MFNRDFGLCQDCGKPGEEVHHEVFLKPDNIDNPDITMNPDLLVTLCRDCHFTRHTKRRKSIDDEYYFDEDGNMCKRVTEEEAMEEAKVYIVYGSPGSGKNYYVNEHMSKGDIVIDLDLLLYAIGLQGKGEAPNNLVDTALSMREHLYDLIARREVKCKNVWVVAGLPKQWERKLLSNRLKADDEILIDASKDKCISNAMNDMKRIDKAMQVRIIEKWFEEFS